jgi:molybdopterin/thiamine biosynthesis adenylyltransferase
MGAAAEEFPGRYLRNKGTFSLEEQKTLGKSAVLVAGAGGLGGNIVDILARTGTGRITISDGDVFEASNLNRQILCTERNLKKNKAEESAKRVQEINSGITAVPLPFSLTSSNLPDMLKGQDLVIDALGGVQAKRMLLAQTARAGLPLVSGFVAGWLGLAATVMPGDTGPDRFWQGDNESAAENSQGCIAPVTGLIASIQACEALRLLCGRKPLLRGRILCADLEEMSFNFLQIRE